MGHSAHIRQKYQKEFISRSTEVHQGRYDYSKVEYRTMKTKVIIGCPEHGDFLVEPDKHMRGQRCRKCWFVMLGASKRISNEEFIDRSLEIHKGEYDYTSTEFVIFAKKVTIRCPKHGSFKMLPDNHLKGQGCPKCRVNGVNAAQFSKGRAVIYIVDLGDAFKVGITKRPKTRLRCLKNEIKEFYRVQGFCYLRRGDAKKLRDLEQEVLTCGLFDRLSLQNRFIGGSECFSKRDLPHVMAYLEEKLT